MKRKNKRRVKVKNRLRFTLISTLTLVIIISLGFWISSLKAKNNTDNSSNKKIVEAEKPKETPPKEEVKKEPPKETHSEILLTSVGDCTLGRDDKYAYENSLPYIFKKNNNDYSYFFKNVYEIFKNDDITIANLEGTFTDSKAKASKSFTFKAPTNYAKILTHGSIEGVNLSNNHIYDYLDKGFEDTKKALETVNVPYFGEGNIWKTEVKGIKLAFLGYRGFYSSDKFLKKLADDIKSLKSENYVVIINLHWGKEGSYYPIESQKTIAHHAIDNGADLIIGHHPHVIEGIEKYKGRLICYSLGNFCFGGNKNPRDKDTMIVQVKFNFTNDKFNSYDFKVIPCSISSVNYMNDYCPTPLKGDKKASLIAKINKISSNLDFKIDGEFHNIKVEN
ncbi:CapA family protein [Clostridium ganghwense]|uniref:CapA family protein n=1 Tax=Clostridium ganghwense TaxID=312089 RepID=A0ABT4CRU9_9CLOT|nr:CapA family protein [Clostridium ganghwense]MCY6370946.1 CapA family protein [Clostridium ganghwense]